MRSPIRLIVLAVAIAAAPAFAETNEATGMWKGTVERDGKQVPMVLRLKQKGGIWKGRADVAGTASPLTKVQVEGNHVTFAVKGQGTFDGTYSENSLTGSLSGTKKGKAPGSVSLTRQEESEQDLNAAIDKVVGSSGP
ncbi:MAG TPA: hypothetical protein VG454_06325 [Gemmatimonadales bacterium]|nr:hypothetical protein [Gemmatimonadales bacterium]